VGSYGVSRRLIIDWAPCEHGTVDRTRPLCPYPQIAKYKGTGRIDEAANFTCSQ